MIGIILEPVIGMPRNSDRHRPESPEQGLSAATQSAHGFRTWKFLSSPVTRILAPLLCSVQVPFGVFGVCFGRKSMLFMRTS
jgi:hypothetical protein